MANISLEHLVPVFVAFLFGGILKGATGVGAPFLAVPIMAIIVDVPFAVAVFLIPNIISNAWQSWRYRKDNPSTRFATTFAVAGVVGAGVGTMALAKFSSSFLTTTIALIVLGYGVFRLNNPNWRLAFGTAQSVAGPIGGVGGFFQGAIGLSGPIAVTFMSTVGLARKPFIYTMSLYFFAMTMIQLPVQVAYGIMTLERLSYGIVALGPLLLGMTLGDRLGQRLQREVFDRIILVVLTLLAIRLLVEAFT